MFSYPRVMFHLQVQDCPVFVADKNNSHKTTSKTITHTWKQSAAFSLHSEYGVISFLIAGKTWKRGQADWFTRKEREESGIHTKTKLKQRLGLGSLRGNKSPIDKSCSVCPPPSPTHPLIRMQLSTFRTKKEASSKHRMWGGGSVEKHLAQSRSSFE